MGNLLTTGEVTINNQTGQAELTKYGIHVDAQVLITAIFQISLLTACTCHFFLSPMQCAILHYRTITNFQSSEPIVVSYIR